MWRIGSKFSGLTCIISENLLLKQDRLKDQAVNPSPKIKNNQENNCPDYIKRNMSSKFKPIQGLGASPSFNLET